MRIRWPENCLRNSETTKTTKRDSVKDFGFKFFIKIQCKPKMRPETRALGPVPSSKIRNRKSTISHNVTPSSQSLKSHGKTSLPFRIFLRQSPHVKPMAFGILDRYSPGAWPDRGTVVRSPFLFTMNRLRTVLSS
jgi:hypothetical protein